MRIFTADGSDVAFVAVGQEATGIIAIGQIANGVVAIGQVATGVVAIGQLARGFFAVGMLAAGVVSVGMLGIGVVWTSGMLAVAPFAGPGMLVLGLLGRLSVTEAFSPHTRWSPPWKALPPWRVFLGTAGLVLLAVLWWYTTGMGLMLPRIVLGFG
ncbi:hypothetical protein ABGB12_02965 [Actinocorallia sp. B10E7]|uniref:hypothetical protein n=1 Tax=Actinocorallia sp. B10E7 TaxID=3153558 RepID=UPI00325E5513